jgi:hypothetical protein
VPTYPLEELRKSEGGIFADFDYSHISPIERGRKVRKWLKEREEQHIVGTSIVSSQRVLRDMRSPADGYIVVTHGDILRCMVDGVSRYLSDHPEIAENFRVRLSDIRFYAA